MLCHQLLLMHSEMLKFAVFNHFFMQMRCFTQLDLPLLDFWTSLLSLKITQSLTTSQAELLYRVSVSYRALKQNGSFYVNFMVNVTTLVLWFWMQVSVSLQTWCIWMKMQLMLRLLDVACLIMCMWDECKVWQVRTNREEVWCTYAFHISVCKCCHSVTLQFKLKTLGKSLNYTNENHIILCPFPPMDRGLFSHMFFIIFWCFKIKSKLAVNVSQFITL